MKIVDTFILFYSWFLWIFRSRKHINIKIAGYLTEEEIKLNYTKYLYIFWNYWSFFLQFFHNFPAKKTNFLNISGIYLLFSTISRPVGIFMIFPKLLAYDQFCQKHFWVAYVSHQIFPKKEFPFWEKLLQKHFWDAYVSHQKFPFLVSHMTCLHQQHPLFSVTWPAHISHQNTPKRNYLFRKYHSKNHFYTAYVSHQKSPFLVSHMICPSNAPPLLLVTWLAYISHHYFRFGKSHMTIPHPRFTRIPGT